MMSTAIVRVCVCVCVDKLLSLRLCQRACGRFNSSRSSRTVFSGTLSDGLMMFTASHAPSLTFWQTQQDCINKHSVSSRERFPAVTWEAWKYGCHQAYDLLFQSMLQSTQNPSLLMVSSSSRHKHLASLSHTHDCDLLQWKHLWGAEPPNPNDPLLFPPDWVQEYKHHALSSHCLLLFLLTKHN